MKFGGRIAPVFAAICFKCVFPKLKPTVTSEFVYDIPRVINSGQNKIAWICRPRVYWCNVSKFNWPMKDMSINQSKKVGGRNFEEEFSPALFFVSPTPHYVPRETKIEPDRRLSNFKIFRKYLVSRSPSINSSLLTGGSLQVNYRCIFRSSELNVWKRW